MQNNTVPTRAKPCPGSLSAMLKVNKKKTMQMNKKHEEVNVIL